MGRMGSMGSWGWGWGDSYGMGQIAAPAGGQLTVTIDNSGGGALSDYQVRVEVEYVTGMRSDFNDVRFVGTDGSTALSHWREYYTDSKVAIFWCKVPTIGAGATIAIYLNYGVETDTASDDSATMIVGTDFDDAATTGLTINIAGAGAMTVPTLDADQMLGVRVNPFIKYGDGPVLAKGTAGAWDDWGVREIAPVIDTDGYIIEEADGIWAYYWGRPDAAGTMQIGLVKSTDFGYTWTRYVGNPVIAPSGAGGSWYQTHVNQPSVIKLDNGTYLMIAGGWEGGTRRIGAFTSADGLAWVDQGAKLALADFQDSDDTAIDQIGVPCLIKRAAGDYAMLLEAKRAGVDNAWRLFGALSADGLTWTPLNGGYPLLSPTGAGWEATGVANGHCIEVSPGNYLLAYNGMGTTTTWQIGFATSTDFLSWTRYVSNPVLSPGDAGAWDDKHTETSFLVKEDSALLRLYYQGFNDVDGSHQIGLAITRPGRILRGSGAANADGYVAGCVLGVGTFAFEVLSRNQPPASSGNDYVGLIDSGAVPSPGTVATINTSRRITASRVGPSDGTNPNKFVIQYRTTSDTFLSWNGTGWQAGLSYHGGAGLYKIRIVDDGTNYELDILEWPTGTSILASPASVAKADVKAFSLGRIAFAGEIFTDAYYVGMDYDNFFIRNYAEPEPTVAVS